MSDRGALICDALKREGVEYVAWLADSETHFMHDAMLRDPGLRILKVCSEGEALTLCAGLHMGGKRGVVLIENQGLFDAGNALKWLIDLRFPIVLLVGYLAYHKLEDSPRGKVKRLPQWGEGRDPTEPFLEAFELWYRIVDSDDDVAKVGAAFAEAERSARPAVLLLTTADAFVPGT